MIKTIKYKENEYLSFQAEGNAAQFIMPFAKHICKGQGLDIGCHKLEWALSNAIPIDLTLDDEYDAYMLPHGEVDYIFSSHCLEHLSNWAEALEYWITRLKVGGVLFLYLPHYDQEYWRPWNNKQHIHALTAEMIEEFLWDNGFTRVYTTGRDLNHSFAVVAEL